LTVISNIPGSWLVTNLDNVSIAVTGKTPSTTDEFNWGGEIPFITPTQILPAGAVEMPDRFVTEQGAQKIQLLPKGAVLIVCIGTIGKVGLLDTDAAFNQQINALIPTNSILSKFLFYWAKTLHSWLNKTSSAVVNAAIINKSRLCAAPCPLPSIAEQTEIVRRVEELFAFADRIEQAAQAALSRVNNLTQSILAKAFRGELTADWRAANPDLITGDNSAEALLAKIKAERAKLSKNTKAKA
jgi:type I restriction enzyme S subunit